MSNETYIDFPDAAAQIATPQPSDLIPVYRPAALEGDPAAVTGLASATMQQLGELAGLDHSKLEEQAVPGEFFAGLNGEKKQVYTATRFARYPSGYRKLNAANDYVNIMWNRTDVESIVDYSFFRSKIDTTTTDFESVQDNTLVKVAVARGAMGNTGTAGAKEDYLIPCQILLTVKYTKIW